MKFKKVFDYVKKIASSAAALFGCAVLGCVAVCSEYKAPEALLADGAPVLGDTYFTGDYYGANILTENGLFSFSASPYLYQNVNGSPNFSFQADLGYSYRLDATCANGANRVYYGLKIQELTYNAADIPENGYFIVTGIPEFLDTVMQPNLGTGAYYGGFIMDGTDVSLDLSSPYCMANIYQRYLSSDYYGRAGYYSTLNFVFNAADVHAAFNSLNDTERSFNIVFVYNPPDNTNYMSGFNVGIKNLNLLYVETTGEADTGYLNGFTAGYDTGYSAGLAEQNYKGPFANATIRAGIISPLYYQDYHLSSDDIILTNPAPFVVSMDGDTESLMETLAENYQENAPSSAPLLREVYGYEFTFDIGAWSTSAFGSIGFGMEFGNSVYIDIKDGSGRLITTYEGNSADDYNQLRYIDLTQYKDAYITRILYTGARAELLNNFRIDFSSSYSTGYNAGYADGLEVGSAEYQKGYNHGYDDGYARGLENGSGTLLGPIAAIAGIPATVITSLFNFNVLGVNILGLVTGLITIAVIAWVIKKFI